MEIVSGILIVPACALELTEDEERLDIGTTEMNTVETEAFFAKI